ncbi:hypothetical protein [Nonomuraea sp. NPDC049400]|uniref:hypothetical protein n=1 Tax=Nonomuraea sp. NPDC049400 TaxID=3364352 RepID=UPI00378EC405
MTDKRSLFIVITTQNADGDAGTTSHELTVPAGTKHVDLLYYVMTECVPEHRRDGIVLHYSVHPAVIA